MSTTNLQLESIELTDNMQTSLLDKMNSNFAKIDNAYNILKNALLQKTKKDNLAEAIAYIDNLVDAQDATITPDKVFNGYTGYKGNSKIIGTALATKSTGDASQLLVGKTLYDSSGTLITGKMANRTGKNLLSLGSLSEDYYQLKVPVTGYYDSTTKLQRTKENVISDLGIIVMPNINVTLTGKSTYMGYISGYGAGIDQNGNLVIWAMSNTTSYEHINFVDTSIGVGTVGNGWNITTGFDTADAISIPHACTITGLSGYNTINITLNATGVDATDDYINVQVTLTAE